MKNKLNIFLILVSFIFLNTGKAHAGWWSESISAEIMHQAWAQMAESLKGQMLSELKNKAMETFGQNMDTINEHYLVSDYNTELSGLVRGDMINYTNNYFDSIKSKETIANDGYISDSINWSKDAILNDLSSDPEYSTIENFVGGNVKENLFKEKIGNTGLSGGIDIFPMILDNNNNAYARHLQAANHIDQTKEVAREARKTEVIAGGGYKTVGEFAGSTFAAMAAKDGTYKQDLIANAETLPELAGIIGSDISEDQANMQGEMEEFQNNFQDQFEDEQDGQIKDAFKGLYTGKGRNSLIQSFFTSDPISLGIGSVLFK